MYWYVIPQIVICMNIELEVLSIILYEAKETPLGIPLNPIAKPLLHKTIFCSHIDFDVFHDSSVYKYFILYFNKKLGNNAIVS